MRSSPRHVFVGVEIISSDCVVAPSRRDIYMSSGASVSISTLKAMTRKNGKLALRNSAEIIRGPLKPPKYLYKVNCMIKNNQL